ncbi:MATE family efflux transporter [Niabella ginsengisoli]|uniref:MATE family efflux transporter n=1 Tax=Niabella ginsengisoli TaxID=522298 RepID=UPI00374DF4E2
MEFFGNAAFSAVNEGSNFILNLFGGPVANAARGITYQIRGALMMFIGNIQIASNPYLTELYAKKDHKTFFNTFFSVSKASFFILSLLCLPFLFYTSYILDMWLHEVPKYTESFIQLTVYFLLVRVFHGPIDSIFKAVGNIKSIKY